MNKIQVLIADDHKIFRDGIRALLKEAKNIHVIADAGNGIFLPTLLTPASVVQFDTNRTIYKIQYRY